MRRSIRSTVAALGLAALACPTAEPVTQCNKATSAECHTGYKCDTVTATCLRQCTTDDDCLASQYCDVDNDVCRSGDPGADGGDPAGADPAAD